MTTDNHDQALEARARELLAAEYERFGWLWVANNMRDGLSNEWQIAAIRAIVAALREGMPRKTFPVGEVYQGSGRFPQVELYEYVRLFLAPGTKLYAVPQSPEVPPGYALVPVEPTPEMLGAGSLERQRGGANRDVYRAMLAATTPTKCTIQHIEPEK